MQEHVLHRGHPAEPLAVRPLPAKQEPVGGSSHIWPLVLGEFFAAVFGAVLMPAQSPSIEVNPLERIGQVSALAGLVFRFTAVGLVLLVAVLVASNVRWPAALPMVNGLACATVAGLASGLIAAGVLVALRGTTWPLNGVGGDAGQLSTWAADLIAGHSMPDYYPPAYPHAVAWWAEITGTNTSSALRTVEIVATSLFGPVAYVSWRLLLRPTWALAIGLVAALPLIDVYKPYTNVVLVALVPITVKFLHIVRRCGTRSWPQVMLFGAVFGAVFGMLFLIYSGWFVWSAAGVVTALLVVLPWRSGALRALTLVGIAGAVFTAIAQWHLLGLLTASGSSKDTYFYFDTDVEPTYIAMWRTDLPGNPGLWPPPGELAGVGLFSALLVLGLGVAIAVGRNRTVVITVGCCLANAWLMRFWFASQMYETKAVQLYPRTTPEILYCLLVLSGFAVYFVVQSRSGQLSADPPGPLSATVSQDNGSIRPSRVSPVGVRIGVLCGLLLFAAFAGSSVADRYMPRADNSLGSLAYIAQMVRQPNGSCSAYSAPNHCANNGQELVDRMNAGTK